MKIKPRLTQRNNKITRVMFMPSIADVSYIHHRSFKTENLTVPLK